VPKIVLVGQDISLLETRAEVLKKTGAEVVHCVGSEVLDVVAVERPELVVLCHSLPHGVAEEIADGVHEFSPTTKVLLVVSQVVAHRPHQDAKFDAVSLPEPVRLVANVAELLETQPVLRQEPAAL
jgi:response regulator RpfG family c-di-GMP phosphodiesterase